MNSAQHFRAFARQMLLHARAEAEMRSRGIKQDRRNIEVFEMRGECAVERRDHGGIDEVGLGTVQPKPQQAAFGFKPDLEGGGHEARNLGWMLSVSSSDHGVFAARARRSAMKSASRPLSRVPSLKARNP